ncbi:hypothetical protein N5V81_14155 [Escherichia coli]|nr:hypothetical protein [Escherichia coli]
MMWMIDPYYRIEEPDGKRAHAGKRVLEEHGFVRGLRNLVDNHVSIFNILTTPEAGRKSSHLIGITPLKVNAYVYNGRSYSKRNATHSSQDIYR